MRFSFRWATFAASALAVGLTGYVVPAGAATTAHAASSAAHLAAAGGVSAEAAVGTPELHKVGQGKNSQEVIRQLVQCGTDMYAVGQFSEIDQTGTVYNFTNIFRFSATAPYAVDSTWAPDVNGQVNAIAFVGGNCADAYIGGEFTSINGTPANYIAEIDTTTGDVVPTFGSDADNFVWTIAATTPPATTTAHLLVGGDFIHVNGTKENHFASLDPVTGDDDGFVHLNISGTYTYCAPGGSPCTDPRNRAQVYNQQLSHGGTLDLVEGRFTSVGGLPRQQIFMLDLSGTQATVTPWTSPEWDGSDTTDFPNYQCWPSLAFYIRSAAWSPDDSSVYIASTGYHPVLTNSNPRTGLCDSVSAWSATMPSTGPLTHTWIEYSGCDSYYSVGADSSAVYAAGHPRWADNPNGCDHAGPGAVADPGLQGHDPATGTVELNSGGTALYTMTRANAGNMLITSAGLWISSTNRYTVNKCGDLTGPTGHNSANHAGICFLPYSS